MSVSVCSAPDDFRINPDAVEAVLQHPAQPEVSSLHVSFFVEHYFCCFILYSNYFIAFSASSFLVGRQKENPACKN